MTTVARVTRGTVVLVTLALIGALVSAGAAFASARITQFDAHISVRADGTLDVVERITVNADGEQVRHGITRDLALTYTDLGGKPHSAAYTVSNVRRDGNEEPWRSARRDGMLRLTIGSPSRRLSPGLVRYEIRYTTDYQLAFEPGTDTLYWNVTGNNNTLPIDQASATIAFADGVKQIEFTAFTGPKGSRERDVAVRKNGARIEVKSTRALAPNEGLTVLARWPQGAILRPEGVERFRRTSAGQQVFDAIHTLLGSGIAALALLWALLYAQWRRFSRVRDVRDDITVTTPPANLSPAVLRWLDTGTVDSRSLAAALTSLAAKGRIEFIDYNTNHTAMAVRLVTQPTYDASSVLSPGEQAVMDSLFSRPRELRLSEAYADDLDDARQALSEAIESEYEARFFDDNTRLVFSGIATAAVLLGLWFFLVPDEWRSPWSFFVVSALGCFTLFYFSANAIVRTPRGSARTAQVRSFARYLGAEHGASNTVLAEDFNMLLPYAVALDCAKPWSTRALAGMPAPAWYTGSLFTSRDFVDAIDELDAQVLRGAASGRRHDHSEGAAGGGSHNSSSGSSGGGGGGTGGW